ncbi:protein DEK isoform X2 [Antennarius striatus]|uniref:protein DEK isoform X2 n=1 Tax=Antennarius striatus TaxID=241820 RepID=UPI0035AFBDCF
MDSSVLSDEELEDQQEAPQEDRSSLSISRSKISGGVVEGKRTKKTVERLDFQAPKQKEKLKTGDGSGEKLGDVPRIGYQITRTKPADLKPLHAILFDRPGKMASIKKTLRLFNGFPFDAGSEPYARKRDKLLRTFTNNKLKLVCGVLDLEKKGTHADLVDRIMTFLIAPRNSGKRLPVKKKRKSKKKLSADDPPRTKKSKPRARSSSSRTGSKSKAIVMDSSSDEDDREAGAWAGAEGSEGKASEREDEASDASQQSEEEQSPKSKSGKAKSTPQKLAPAKRQRTPTKKNGPPRKRSRKAVSDESEADSDDQPNPPPRPTARTKKADSSSNSRANPVEDSDSDELLINVVKKPPSDEQLRATLRRLLEDADLEEVTMKQICQQVFDTYPEHDLTGRKDYIKHTVKALIT